MERGLIKHFYKRPHADQILVTFGLAIVMQEVIKYFYGANPIPTPAPDVFKGSFDFGAMLGFEANSIIYPYWRLVYFSFAAVIIGGVFAFLQFTTFGMVVRAGMADRETVGLLGINIDKRFTIMFGLAAAVAGLAGVMYTPINSPNYHMGMDFLVLSFVVVVVGGMGSLSGAVLAGFLLGILSGTGYAIGLNTVLQYFPPGFSGSYFGGMLGFGGIVFSQAIHAYLRHVSVHVGLLITAALVFALNLAWPFVKWKKPASNPPPPLPPLPRLPRLHLQLRRGDGGGAL